MPGQVRREERLGVNGKLRVLMAEKIPRSWMILSGLSPLHSNPVPYPRSNLTRHFRKGFSVLRVISRGVKHVEMSIS